jgi:hypothetical protein
MRCTSSPLRSSSIRWVWAFNSVNLVIIIIIIIIIIITIIIITPSRCVQWGSVIRDYYPKLGCLLPRMLAAFNFVNFVIFVIVAVWLQTATKVAYITQVSGHEYCEQPLSMHIK